MGAQSPQLRIFYLEDNPLIVFHVETMIEDLGFVFAGSVGSFADLVSSFDAFEMDAALVDIDLADGRTGPNAAAWLHERGIPSIFVTGQVGLAAEYPLPSLGVIAKPISVEDLADKLELIRRRASR
ncbi:response regulator [Labrys sp. LIt4]|uniref:Response regulator n=1 Tax=Labrys okinawensis TaxID=346911 RepID=A0A2S9Q675_9HYPH|nr:MULTISPECIES: response regulator [Labrys]MBP0583042.1 response regulator [Labrys sp. LIt4]PRH84837.1 response regulator [Labrys okinawensis]